MIMGVKTSIERGPMETFCKLFGSLLAFVYHCFDRIVIQGYLPLLTRPEHIVYFFRDVHGIYPITKQALAKRTREYQAWVEAFARNHRIPMQWPDPNMRKKDMKKEDFIRPYYLAMERRRRFGVYFIFKSLEQYRRSFLPMIPITASCTGTGPATRTTTSTSATKSSAPW